MGREYHIYEKLRAGIRNEALDIRVYATAARAIIVPKFDEWAARESAKRIKTASSTVAIEQPPGSADVPRASNEVTKDAMQPDTVENPVENAPEPTRKSRFRVRNNNFGGYDPQSW
jgi:phage terminase large subunit GpA-like protein